MLPLHIHGSLWRGAGGRRTSARQVPMSGTGSSDTGRGHDTSGRRGWGVARMEAGRRKRRLRRGKKSGRCEKTAIGVGRGNRMSRRDSGSDGVYVGQSGFRGGVDGAARTRREVRPGVRRRGSLRALRVLPAGTLAKRQQRRHKIGVRQDGRKVGSHERGTR